MRESYRKIGFLFLFLLCNLVLEAKEFSYSSTRNVSGQIQQINNSNNAISTTELNGYYSELIFESNTQKQNVFISDNVEVNEFKVADGAEIHVYASGNPTVTITKSFKNNGKIKFHGKVNWQFKADKNDIVLENIKRTVFTGDVVFSGKNQINIKSDLQIDGNLFVHDALLNVTARAIVCDKLEFKLSKKNNSEWNNVSFITGNVIGDDEKYLKRKFNVLTGYRDMGSPKTLCSAPTPFTIVATATSDYNGFDVSCNNSTDGTICVNVTGGVGPFNYQWVSGPTTPCYSGVDAGSYIVVVFDMGQGGISCFTTVTVTEPTEMTLLSWTGTNPSCYGVCDATASPVIVGGVPSYNYLWSTGETTPTAVALCNGLNTLHVTDANGCVFDTTFFILIPTPIAPNVTIQNVSCNGLCDGVVISNPSGGNGAPYTFSWTGGSINDTVTGLCAGNITVTVTDNSGCSNSETVTITQPPPLIVSLVSITNLVCNGVCSGSITITSSNGTLPHTYQWYNASTSAPIPGATSATVSGLCAGSYYVVVTDAGGCVFQSTNFTITQPPAIMVSVMGTNLTCNGVCNGTLTATAAGGTGPLSVSWYNASSSLLIGTGTPLSGVCAGTYFAQVTDANGCIVNSSLITITQPPALNISIAHTDVLCAGSCTGTATATLSGGSGALSLSWHNSPSGTLVGIANPITGLCAGNYFATVTDANGCTLSSPPFTIDEPLPLTIVSQANVDVTCNGACDGTATFTVSGGTGTINITWFQFPGSVPIGQTGNTATGLCPGTYFAVATDANGCVIQSANQVITQPTALNVTVTPTSSECGTTCTGSALANISGGTSPYALTWVNATTGSIVGTGMNPITGLCAGNYYVVVTDAHGCVDTSAVFTITSAVIVSGTIIGTDVTCNGFCNGFANLTPLGGIAPYTFVWYDQVTGLPIGQSTEDANGLCAGSYYVIITDVNGCNSVPFTITIDEPTPITINTVVTNTTCNGVCNGQIQATVSGGTPAYTLVWYNATTNLPIGQTGLTATGLCPGTYFLQVTDQNGCVTTSTNITITEPLPIAVTLSSTNVTCFGLCNGTAFLSVTGGLLPYTVTWSSSANTTLNETNLCAGNYTYTVTDNAGCVVGPINFSITQPTNITTTLTSDNVSCSTSCDGSVSINVSGGNAPYTYSWDDPAGQTFPVASNLCAGTYNVIVTDINGCVYGPYSTSVTAPSSLLLSTTGVDAMCTGGCNGSATVVVTGGTSPITLSWNDPLNQSTPTANGLCAGTYIVTATDGGGCVNSDTIVINASPSPAVSLNATNVSCNGLCDGTASALISGGTAPYIILWNTGSSATNLTNLCAGTFSLQVTDNSGCVVNATTTITEPTAITATVSTTTTPCTVCNATATVTPTGGASGYTYLWSVSAGSQTTPTAVGLCAGIHTVEVTDASGCTEIFTVAVSNSTSEFISVDSTNATCNGLCDGTATVSFTCSDPPCTVQWNDAANQTTPTATGLCENVYGVTVTNASGCITAATVSVGAPQAIQPNATAIPLLCNGTCTGQGSVSPTGGNGVYTYLWSDPAAQTAINAFNLCPATYTVTVTDSIGCSAMDTITITEPSPVVFTTAVNDVNCFGACDGSAIAFPIGGNPPYTYAWDDPLLQTTQAAVNLCAGDFNVTVFDNNGCTIGPQTITVNEPVAPSLSISSTNPFCFGDCNGTATVTVVGGTAPYSFLWNDPFAQTNATATNLCPGTYTVTVTDANGCTIGVQTITITAPQSLAISLTPANITCNGLCDGTIAATIVGGTGPYSITWNDPAAQTTATAGALCGGTYTVTVQDINGCVQTNTATITEPVAITPTLIVNDVLCNGDCNGNASITGTGGSGTLTPLWMPGGQTTNNISGLCPGNYFVTLTDTSGCNTQVNFAINEPPVFSFLTGMSPAECGVCNGSASVSPIGGTTPYTIQWNAAAANQTTVTALNLCAGIYGVTITDANGCALNTNVGVSNFDGENVSVSTTDASCPDVCNGTATMSTPCVNGPCSFAWFNASTGASLGISSSTATGLCPGGYIAQVINSVGCTTLVMFDVNGPDTIDVADMITNLTCNNVCNGSIALSATGGTGSLNFQWDAAAGSATTSTVTGLCAGNYSVVITDAIGCDDTLTYTIIQPLPINTSINTSLTLCSGTCSGIATAIVSGGTPGYTYLWNDPLAQTSSSASGLCNGSYTLTVTDDNGCTATSAPVTINQPAALNISVNTNDATCFGDCDGTATVNISGGTTPYATQWDDPLNQTTLTATNLCAGTYTVTVTDANNCSVGPQSVTLNSTLQITATLTVLDVLCNGTCNGEIKIIPSGGTAPYLFSINNGSTFQTSNNFVGLCAGSYQVLIQDSNGCQSELINVNVNEPTPLDATTASFPADCGDINGAVSVFPLGGTPSYNVVWTDGLLVPIGQTTNTAINLDAGIYIAIITDANGCEFLQSVTLSNTTAPVATATTVSPSCNGDCNGAIDVTVTDGTAPYAYAWMPNGQTTEDIVNACAGNYTLQVTDAVGCISFTTFNLTEPQPITTNTVVADATCGQCNGTASVVVSGGTGASTIVWSNLQTGTNATNLCGGTYSYLVTDANGCHEQFTVLVNNTSAPTLVIDVTTPTCLNTCSASALASAIGGIQPYVFSWVDLGSSNPNQTNLCSGTYIVEVQDSAGCVALASINIPAQILNADSVVVSPATCGSCDGTAVVFATGMTPFTYQWSATAGGVITPAATSLCQGLYSVIITDAAGCSDTSIAMVPNSNAPVLTITPNEISCYGVCDGGATASGTGGTSPYVIDWYNSGLVQILANATSITSQCAGEYYVEITDALGCGSFASFTLTSPDSLVASINFVTDETCFNACDGVISAMPISGTLPFTYNWTNPPGVVVPTATGLCDGVYTVNVIDAHGCTLSLTDTVNEPAPIVIALDSTDASCSTVADGAVDATVTGGAGGFVYSWSGPSGFTSNTEDITGIFPGMYVLTVTDANGCTFSDSIIVNAILIAEANAGNDTSMCAVTGGILLTGIGTPGATYTWTDVLGTVLSTTNTLSITATSTTVDYIFIVNNSGCIDVDTVTVTLNPLPTANAGDDQEILAGQTVTIGGNPTTNTSNTVLWSPSEPLNDALIFNPSATPDSTMEFVVQVTDGNGCVNYDTVLVTIFPSIVFPNGFSPNGDGANDTWILDFIEAFPDAEVSVYNRWGQPVFYSKGYDIPWDGTYESKPVTVGTYYYVILLNHPLFPDAFTGPLTILR